VNALGVAGAGGERERRGQEKFYPWDLGRGEHLGSGDQGDLSGCRIRGGTALG